MGSTYHLNPVTILTEMNLPSLMLLPMTLFGAAHEMVTNKVVDEFTPAPFESQQIEGLLAERMRVNLEGRLLHVNEQAILAGFKHRPGEQEWIGEHAGKFLDAAANTWMSTHDARLKTLMDRVAHSLIAAQLPDGYLGTYTDDQRWTNWDVWVHKYDLIGLLSYYRVTGDPAALGTAKKIGDLLVRTFGNGEGQRDIIRSGTHVGMAATSVLEPMVSLYRYTGERAYLDFCFYLVGAWEQANGPHIISSLMTNGSVFRTANAKAYEMLSNLVGLLELYRVTGDVRYFTPVLIAWSDIVDHRLYISGTASSSEHFRDNDVLPAEEKDNVGEGCVTVTWMQLNLELLRLTGDAKFGDQLERTVFNQLLAAQNPHNGDICYFTPLDGKKQPGPGISCCVSSEPRGISLIPETVWGQRAGGIAVVQYAPGRLDSPPARIESATDFPLTGHVVLTVHPLVKGAFPIYLRVPDWTKSYVATVDGTKFEGHPGEFLTLERVWKGNDRIEIQMDMTVELISGGLSYPHSVAIRRGPQVLALESSLNRTAEPASLEKEPAVTPVDSIPVTWLGHQAYKVEAKSGPPLVMVPFADSQDARVWLNAR
jgi:DUF1680 family protein